MVETTGQAAALLAGVDTDRLGICLDLAHLACAWEEPAAALDRLRAAGLPIVKVQVSAALEAADPVADAAGAAPRTSSRASCTRRRVPARPADRVRADDLDAALAAAAARPVAGALPRAAARPARAAADAPPLPVLRAALARAARRPDGRLRPPRRRDVHLGRAAARRGGRRTDAELAAGIAAELAFARDAAGRRSAWPPTRTVVTRMSKRRWSCSTSSG